MSESDSERADEPAMLVIKLSSLGDLFHALPAVHNLKAATGARIDWVTQREYVELVGCFTDVRRVIAVDRRRFFRGLPGLWGELRRERYDFILDLQGLLKSAVTARMARGGARIGPSFHREGARFLYTRVAGPRNKERHAVDENLDVVRALELDVGMPEFPVRFPAYETDLPGPRVAIVPSSRWPSKTWAADSFAAVARVLRDMAGASVFLLGAAGDTGLCGAVDRAAGGGLVNLAGQTTLAGMGGVLAAMDLLIANDSGPIHMAAAVDTPVLAIFGPTDERRTGPFGRGHRVMADGATPCRPCFRRVCPRGGSRCLQDVTAQAVTGAALEMLGLAPSV